MGWISVEDALPELYEKVLCIVRCKDGFSFINVNSRGMTSIFEGKWKWGEEDEVVYWMPLELPEDIDRDQIG